MPTDYLATDTEFTDVADAIRAKGGTSATLSWPTGFVSAIQALPSAAVLQAKTATPTTSQQVISPDSGYDGLSQVTVSAMPSGSAGTPTATKGTVSNHAISVTPSVTNTTGYITGGTKTGTAVSVAASELVSGTYTVSASGTADVTDYASVSVPAGTAGTPSATKGTVSNHAISVTPSVTNSTGWITGSTKTGTAVSVAASELVSGSETKTANGTYDVTNLSELVVNVPSGIGTLLATQSLGSLNISSTSATNLNKSVTVPNAGNYDLLIVDTSRDGATATANYHRSTVRPIYLWGTPSTPARTSSFLVGAISFKYDNHAASTTSNASNTGYGIYPNSVSLSNGTATLALYGRYNSTYSGTINGNYTTRVYGVNLYDLIGG